ncbi:FecR family protein [Chitinophaga sp. SYP-B3965]|uniref:FecR family protein n=1 Tax=Chitinophaga sp. SYP-B3965 TaxID=2663120 RepID=UPI001565171E|nr:FecR family protein [Chitinophaga sp. SYP-B3965]
MNKTASPAEVEEFMELLNQGVSKEEFSPMITREWEVLQDEGELSIEKRKAMADRILKTYPAAKEPKVRFIKTWMKAAAVIAILLTAGTYLITRTTETQITAEKINDAAPGTSKAILTLADGSTVTLDSAGQQMIPKTTAYQQGGKLAYNKSNSTEITYHTLTVPRGGQFQLELSDGTKVWLNAASSLRYPTVFEGKERKVEVTGEAYFEVAKNAEAPFRVMVNQRATVEVLGTIFNINAYTDEEDIKTTLLEGSVKIGEVVLKPGQQAQLAEQIKVVSNVDLDKVTAWKKGVFNFEDADLKEVMRQLSRWYDIDVAYEKNIGNIEFVGKISRSTSLKGVLKGLENTGVQFRLEGKKLTVIK